MFSPSQPFGGTDAESEGRENCEAEDDVEKVQHCKAPLAAVPDIALGLRKGSIREGVGSRKERVKGTRSVAHRPADALSDVVNCNARNRQPTGIQGFGGGEGSTADPSPPPLAHCKPENRSIAGPFSLGAKGVCKDHPPFGDWPAARDRSPNAHRLFPPAPRSRRDGFTIPIHFNELTGSHCARVSPVPACLKTDGDATRAAWSLVCLGSFARSL